MNAPLQFLTRLSAYARQQNYRFVIQLDGTWQWQSDVLMQFIQQEKYTRVLKLGGLPLQGIDTQPYRFGSRFLGMELDCLIYDDSEGLDANSLTAATGALVGGGLLFLLLIDKKSYFSHWINRSFETYRLNQSAFLLTEGGKLPELPLVSTMITAGDSYADQKIAINAIQHVVSGHRKRPLVITADRGRGKSSALGLASAELMNSKNMRIIVTAPARKSVDPLFKHARSGLINLQNDSQNKLQTCHSSLQFISPDELLKDRTECDLLLVDEASSIPVPLLQALSCHYHRVVFSTTVHGYEGCGRGFTLKFTRWLDINRPGWNAVHLTQPIRWQKDDPLEGWMFEAFILDAEMEDCLTDVSTSDLTFRRLEISEQLLPAQLRDCFALLVQAHYQTSPNDLLHILTNPSMHLFLAQNRNKQTVGCILVTEEGGLDAAFAKQIMDGERRPKGQLIAGTIACQLGYQEGVLLSGLRIMRIAVHPELQQRGIGSWMIEQLRQQQDVRFDYMATSFGVTLELLRFWSENSFVPLRLGASRDHASGTHSLLMIDSGQSQHWVTECYSEFADRFFPLLPDIFSDLDPALVVSLLSVSSPYLFSLKSRERTLLYRYCQGTCLYESVLPYARKLALSLLINKKNINIDDVQMTVAKLLQSRSWKEVSALCSLPGRKQSELRLRKEIQQLLEFTV